MMKYFSMFSGIGGFELGIQKAHNNKPQPQMWESEEGRDWGIDKRGALLHDRQHSASCVGFSEIDKYATQIYKKHFPNHKNWGDATKINPSELPDFDMLCGGFPCQSFSIAGKRKGFQDTRGTLFHEILRVLAAKKPGLCLLENVKGLLSADDGRCFAAIISSLEKLGYLIEWEVLNSKYFGVPQNRERVFIIGHLRGKSSKQIFPLGQINKELNKSSTEPRKDGNRLWDYPTNTLSQRDYKGGNQVILQHIAQALQTDGMLRQGTSWGTNKPASSRNIRRLTPIECERLQGFPDGWTKYGINEKGEQVDMSDSQRYKCLGNAVTVNVIQAIAEKIIKVFKEKQVTLL
jgi:DNA (cytosine-5)-methyltransferase 1